MAMKLPLRRGHGRHQFLFGEQIGKDAIFDRAEQIRDPPSPNKAV